MQRWLSKNINKKEIVVENLRFAIQKQLLEAIKNSTGEERRALIYDFSSFAQAVKTEAEAEAINNDTSPRTVVVREAE